MSAGSPRQSIQSIQPSGTTHQRRLAAAVALAAACLASTACSRTDNAPPVATPTATLPSGPALAGRPINVTYRFAVSPTAPPFAEEYTVFVHAIDKEGTRLWTSDHQPPTPTTQWKPGAVVEYALAMTVPSRAPQGPVQIQVGLYSPRSRDRLPLSGEDNGKRAYRVASLDVAASTDLGTTLFLEGWYNLEVPEGEQGVEWRWIAGTAMLRLRNPKRDAVLVLDVDQPATVWSEPQHVTIRSGSTVLEEFDLPQGKREHRRVRLSASDLGQTATTLFTITVDKTFVPAKVPALRNPDTRELGVRVFEAYLDSAPQ